MYADELKQKVISLKGIGKATEKSLANININNVSELLKYIPRSYENRKDIVTLSNYRKGPVNTIVEIMDHDYFGFGTKKTLRVHLQDATGTATLICFGRNFLNQKLVIGKKFFLYGVFEYKFQNLQTSGFEIEEYSDNPISFNKIIPIYPLSGKLNQGILRRAVSEALEELARYTKNQLPEKQPVHSTAAGWTGFHSA